MFLDSFIGLQAGWPGRAELPDCRAMFPDDRWREMQEVGDLHQFSVGIFGRNNLHLKTVRV
jgi:hypothetical protein